MNTTTTPPVPTDDASGINYGKGGTTMYGPDGVGMYRAFVIASGLRLYAKTGMRPNRMYTPKAMMAAAAEITGQKFKARDYIGAADALTEWGKTMKAALPKTVDGKVVP